jgi:sortase A
VTGARTLLGAVSLALCAGGIALAGQGALVLVKAEAAQVELNQAFDRAVAIHAVAKVEPAMAVEAPVGHQRSPVAKAAAPGLIAAPMLLTEPVRPVQVAPGKPLARITVRRLGVRDVILAGPASHDALAKGPMMVKRGDAASPVTVLAAHRDTHFLFVRDLREGDIVTLQYVTGEAERYRVTWFETVRWDAFAYPLEPPRPLLALTTCYPFGGTEYGGPWRRVAWAERVA